MKFIELFAGIGGFRLGLEQSGHECVWANEWLEKPASIYQRNFNHEPNRQDIRTVDPISVPSADIICGGFPCATFSHAGKRSGFSIEDTRGTLFFEICRIASSKKIPYILLENVAGLITHENGRTFGIIIQSLHGMGYDCQWQLCNSRNFGIPQDRQRVFIVANHRSIARPKVFPIIGKFTENDGEKEWGKVYPILTPKRIKKRQNGRRIKGSNEPMFTLTAQDRHGLLIEKENEFIFRSLTPIECERLQGLPDNFTKYYHTGKVVPDNERYERCGRTVTVPIIKEIGIKLSEINI